MLNLNRADMRLFLKAIPLLFAVLAIFLTACSPKPGSPTPIRPGPQPRPSDDFSWLHVVVPPGWHETAPRQYESADGYAWLELLESDGARLEAACIREANREKPQTYGAYPEIRDAPREDQPACLILPSPDQPTERRQEALFLMQVPPSILPDKVLALHADSAHIESFIAALSFTQPLPTLPAATCDFSVAGQAPHVTQIDDLGDEGFRIDEFPIARGANCSPLNDPEGFHQIIQSGAPARRADDIYETQFQGERRSRLNSRLFHFGFRVESDGPQHFKILRAGSEVRTNLSWLGQLSVRPDGQDFFFTVVDGYIPLRTWSVRMACIRWKV